MKDNKYKIRIEKLRRIMSYNGWDAVIITGTDPHSSEYPAPRWKCVEWISGFTGEAGDIVVTADHAGLWTDTRYFIQAVNQLEGTGVELHKTKVQDEVLIPEWLCSHFNKKNITIAVDGLCQSVQTMEEIESALCNNFGQADICSIPDLLSLLWKDRPAIPHTPIEILNKEICGESYQERLAWLRQWMSEHRIDNIFISALDQIAWLLNVRANDIEYNPYIISYLLVNLNDAIWFVRESQSAPQLEGVSVKDYGEAEESLAKVEGRICIDPESTSYAVNKALSGKDTVTITSPISLRKAIKNEVEINNFKEIYIEDGLAMEKFFFWLESSLSKGDTVSEWDASQYLTKLRSEIPGYRGNSFDTISAYGAGAALPHYITPHKDSAIIENHGIYLVDSGGQYLKGTTDITRTIPTGECTQLEKEDYTLVLKGMIDLSMAVFPEGTPGCRIDALAREPLWRYRRNFGHGTGHGTGFYLGVHEGPQSIRQNLNPQPMEAGMITSNEPGIYREGKHGIRHENIILCVKDECNEFGRWLRFETLTCCHIDTSPVIREILTEDEHLWLNAYNRSVFQRLSPRLGPEMVKWLRRKTVSI